MVVVIVAVVQTMRGAAVWRHQCTLMISQLSSYLSVQLAVTQRQRMRLLLLANLPDKHPTF